jgi:hypothetical protein
MTSAVETCQFAFSRADYARRRALGEFPSSQKFYFDSIACHLIKTSISLCLPRTWPITVTKSQHFSAGIMCLAMIASFYYC